MKYLRHLITHYPLSCLAIAVIWYLCLFLDVHVHVGHVKAVDKWTHTTMYLGTGLVMWWEYLRQHKKVNRRRVTLLIWLAPIAMGGLLEILQAYCTGGRRSGEWLDFAANSVGSTLAFIIGILVAKYCATNKKDAS